MKKIVLVTLMVVYLVGLPLFISSVQAQTGKKNNKPVVSKNTYRKSVFGIKTKLHTFFLSFNHPQFVLVNCSMPDGKIIKATKKDCDFVNAFWLTHKPSSSHIDSGSSTSNANSGSGTNSGNNTKPECPTPIITSVTLLPCTSTSCSGISTIKVTGSGFTANSRVELLGSGVTGSYVGGDTATTILTDFINLPAGVYDVRVYSITHDTKDVIKSAAINIP